MINNTFYVYQLVDPRTNRPFYIGKGSGNRIHQHIREAKQNRDRWVNAIKCRIINNILSNGLSVTHEKLYTNLTEVEAFETENVLVRQHGKLINGTGILSNIADGGGVGSSHGKTCQSYTISGAVVNSYATITQAANDVGLHKSTVCAALNGRAILAGGFRWGYENEPVDMRPISNKVPIIQYDMQGNKLNEHESISAASRFVGAKYPTGIVDCIKGKHFSSNEYRWSYFGELPISLPNNYIHPSKQRTLQQLNNGTVVGEFENIKAAVMASGANSSGISDCAAGRKKTSGGFSWRWSKP